MYSQGGSTYMDTLPYYMYLFMENFVCVALVEEGLKRIAVHILTAKNKNFNSLFDGVIYCVFVSLGFAAAENVSYVLQYGFSTAVVRALTAVPGHTCFAVIMGYYYSMWHVQSQAQGIEADLRAKGYLNRGASAFNTRTPNVLSLVFPVLVHGFYDFCCSLDSGFATVLFYGMLIALFVFCFKRVSRVSQDDTSSGKLALGMVFRRYPEVAAAFGIEQTPVYAADAFTGETRTPPYAPQPTYGTQQSFDAQQTNVNPYSNGNPYSQHKP